MFKLTAEHTFWWPVEVKVPDQERAGAIVKQTFKMKFRALPRDEAAALEAEISALPSEEQATRQDDLLRQVCLDWNEEVVDEDKLKIPFSQETLNLALQMGWFRLGVYRAYGAAVNGGAKAGN